jgi:hypothetical protein
LNSTSQYKKIKRISQAWKHQTLNKSKCCFLSLGAWRNTCALQIGACRNFSFAHEQSSTLAKKIARRAQSKLLEIDRRKFTKKAACNQGGILESSPNI